MRLYSFISIYSFALFAPMADVFISYSRKDKEFVEVLYRALQQSKYDTWIDWEDILPTAHWWDEIKAGIEQSDAFIFVITPHSAASRVCREEADYAAQCNKRLVPIMRRGDVDTSQLSMALRQAQWLQFRPENDFDQAFETLVKTLNTNLDYVKAHTRLLIRATEWNRKNRDESLLLRGTDLQEAEQWLATSEGLDPLPSGLQQEYIRASRARQDAQALAEKRLRRGAALGTVAAVAGIALAGGSMVWAQQQITKAAERTNLAEEKVSRAEERLLEAGQELEQAQMEKAKAQQETVQLRQDTAQTREKLTDAQAQLTQVRQDAVRLQQQADQRVRDAAAQVQQAEQQLLVATERQRQAELKFQAVEQKRQRTEADLAQAQLNLQQTQADRDAALAELEAAKQTLLVAQEGSNLERDGTNLLSRIEASPGEINNAVSLLVEAIKIGRQLETLVTKYNLSLENYPATSPLIVLQDIFNQLEPATASPSPIVSYRKLIFQRPNALSSISVSADGRYVAFAESNGRKGTIHIYADLNRQPVSEFATDKAVKILQLSPDGEYVLSLEDGGLIQVHSQDGTPLIRVKDQNNLFVDFALSSDGRILATRDARGKVALWSWRWPSRSSIAAASNTVREVDLQQPKILPTDKTKINSMVFSPDNQLLTINDRNGEVQLWSLDTLKSVRKFNSYQLEVRQLLFSPDAEKIAMVNLAGDVSIWSLSGRQLSLFNAPEQTQAVDASFMQNSQALAIAYQNGAASLQAVYNLPELLSYGCQILDKYRSISPADVAAVCGP